MFCLLLVRHDQWCLSQEHLQQTVAIRCWSYSSWWAYDASEAEAHLLLYVSCCSVCSYRDVWSCWERKVLCQTRLRTRSVPSPGHTHCIGQLKCCHWHWKSWLRVMSWSPWLWYQEHQQLSLEFCKIQMIENCRFLVSKTRSVSLHLV